MQQHHEIEEKFIELYSKVYGTKEKMSQLIQDYDGEIINCFELAYEIEGLITDVAFGKDRDKIIDKINDWEQRLKAITNDLNKRRFQEAFIRTRRDLLLRSGSIIDKIYNESRVIELPQLLTDGAAAIRELTAFRFDYPDSFFTYEDLEWMGEHKQVIEEFLSRHEAKKVSLHGRIHNFKFSEEAKCALLQEVPTIDARNQLLFSKLVNETEFTEFITIDRKQIEILRVFYWLKETGHLHLNGTSLESFLVNTFMYRLRTGKTRVMGDGKSGLREQIKEIDQIKMTGARLAHHRIFGNTHLTHPAIFALKHLP